MTTAMKAPKTTDAPEIFEAPPKFPLDSIEAQAIEKVRGWFKFVPGPLPPLGSSSVATTRPTADMLFRACQAWAASGRRPGYYTQDVVHDHDPLGRAILAGMTEVIRKHDRVVVADAIGEQLLLTGGTRGQLLQNDERMSRTAGELVSIERRLNWLYEVLPRDVAALRPLPPGKVAQRLHARRKELVAALDDAFSASHIPQGRAAVDSLLQHPHPGTPAVVHSVNGWVAIADASRNGAELPERFVEDWSGIVPAACESFEEWPALAEWVLKVN
jgi:hypothetical protein